MIVGNGLDRIAQFDTSHGRTRNSVDCPGGGEPRRSRDSSGHARLFAGPRRAQALCQFQQRPLALSHHYEVERTELKHHVRLEGRFHTAGNNQRVGRESAGDVSQLEVEAQSHPRSGDADHVPRTGGQFSLQRFLRRADAAIRIEDSRFRAVGLQHACKPPDSQWRGEEGVLTAVRIVRTDQQYAGAA